MTYKQLTRKQRSEHLHTEVVLIFCWLSLTSQSSLRRFRPDLPALLPAPGLLRCSVTPGGGVVDHWGSCPSGEVWVEVVEEDVVPLRAPPSVCSAKTVTFKSECFFHMYNRDKTSHAICGVFFW